MSCQRRWDEMNGHERELHKEEFQLRQIWHKTMAVHEENKKERSKIEAEAKLTFLPGDQAVVLNVGGERFDTTVSILTKDRWSVLAALCKEKAPISREGDGSFFIDRDWFIFRYILDFLRNETLPEDHSLLLELYDEASFYRLHSLCTAIQSVPGLHQEAKMTFSSRQPSATLASTL